MVKDLSANGGDTGSNLGSEGCPGGGNGYPLHYFCLLNSMNRGAWQATVHGVSKRWTELGIHTHTHTHTHTLTHITIWVYVSCLSSLCCPEIIVKFLSLCCLFWKCSNYRDHHGKIVQGL